MIYHMFLFLLQWRHMARRKIGLEHVRNIQKSHASYTISIPLNLMRSLKWKERQKVVVRKQGRRLIIKDWK